MTLAMALRAVDGLVLATDSRVTHSGEAQRFTADTSEKFLQVNRDIGVLTYGLAQPGYTGISQLVLAVNQHRWGHFSRIADEAGKIFLEAYDAWLLQGKKQQVPGPVGFILAGYDSLETNQFRIVHYEVARDSGASSNLKLAVISGDLLAAQWHLARYLLSKLYYPEMTVNELAELAVFAITETMTIEETVGGPIQMAVITQTSGFQRLHQQDIIRMLQSGQRRFALFNWLCRNITCGSER